MYRVFVHEFYTAWRWYSIASGSLFSEDSREYFSWDLVLGLIFYVNNSSDSLRGGGGGGGVLSYKSDGGVNRNVSRTPLKGTRILFYGRDPNSFPPLRGTNSTTVNHITVGTANSNSDK